MIVMILPQLRKLRPWRLAPTDLELNTRAAVEACDGRAQVEVNFDEAKELGLGHYQRRSGSGVRRWAVLVCLAQALLKLAATGVIKLDPPKLNWSWYKREETVGQLRRRRLNIVTRTFLALRVNHPPRRNCVLLRVFNDLLNRGSGNYSNLKGSGRKSQN